MSRIIIAIDGPAGSGKGTVSKLLAKRLGYLYIDSGAIYRTIAYVLHGKGLTPETATKEDFAGNTVSFDTSTWGIQLNGEDVEKIVRGKEVSSYASEFSANRDVREISTRLQKEILKAGGCVLEGRDATTVVAPDAELRVYLDCSVEERAKRRLKDFQNKGVEISFEEVLENIQKRDHLDMNKGEFSLRKSEGVIVVDTTHTDIEGVVDELYGLALEKIEQKKEKQL